MIDLDALEKLRRLVHCREATDRQIQTLAIGAGELIEELRAALSVIEAAKSVASEDGVRQELLCYNMGLELIERLAAYDSGVTK